VVVWLWSSVVEWAKCCPNFGERLIPGTIPGGKLARLFTHLGNQSAYTVTLARGMIGDVHIAVVHFAEPEQ